MSGVADGLRSSNTKPVKPHLQTSRSPKEEKSFE